MTFPTHLMAGLILGKITGNYPLSVGIAVGVDIDHVFSYAKNGILLKPRKFIETFYFPFFPYKKINLRGPVKYFSKQEFLFLFLLIIVFFLI